MLYDDNLCQAFGYSIVVPVFNEGGSPSDFCCGAVGMLMEERHGPPKRSLLNDGSADLGPIVFFAIPFFGAIHARL